MNIPAHFLACGIETSCDETAIAIVAGGNRVLSNIVSSQIDLHDLYGGVVPELACRRHIDIISQTYRSAMREAGVALRDLHCIGVTRGPGLIGALLIGLEFAKGLDETKDIGRLSINDVSFKVPVDTSLNCDRYNEIVRE